MSRRTGKAATRRARQQKRTKQGPSPAATTPAPAQDAPVADATTAPATPAPAPRPAAVPAYATGTSSRLGESARLEYHYVGRDLRNTAILTLIMGALLVAAVVAVNLISGAS